MYRDLRALQILSVAGQTVALLILGLVLLQVVADNFGLRENPEQAEGNRSLIGRLRGMFTRQFLQGGGVTWSERLKGSAWSGMIVLIALVWSTTLSFGLGFRLAATPHSGFWDGAMGVFTLVGAIPLFVAGLLAYGFVPFFGEILPKDYTVWHTVAYICFGGVILGSCEGAIGEYPRNVRAVCHELQGKTFYLARLGRGQKTTGLLYETIKPLFWRSLGVRVSYFFGGVIVVEKALGFHGLGYGFIDSLTSQHPSYREALMSGFLVMAIPILFNGLLGLYRCCSTKLAPKDSHAF